MMTAILAFAWLMSGQSACAQAMSGSDAAELCRAEQGLRAGEAQPPGAPRRRQEFEAAADHSRRAATLARKADTKNRAIDVLAQLYDAQHLDRPAQEETSLRELIALRPGELEPMSRLATLQERQGAFDAAEDTLLLAHRRQLDDGEPYRLLAQFYARRATALYKSRDTPKTVAPPANAGEPDENGVYRIGGPIAPPKRSDVAQYPPEARAAGIQGVVLVEIVIDESGDVSDAKVLRSIPMLDEPSLTAVGKWHFTPTVVNGQPVKVRMVVTQNFALK